MNLLKVFPTKLSDKQVSDSGMALVLILLLIGFFVENDLYYKLAIPVLVLNMTFPRIFFPFAVLWLGLSHILGSIMSSILLSIVFVVIVMPMGLFRLILGKDSMRLKDWKKGTKSVMVVRDKIFVSKDLEDPY